MFAGSRTSKSCRHDVTVGSGMLQLGIRSNQSLEIERIFPLVETSSFSQAMLTVSRPIGCGSSALVMS